MALHTLFASFTFAQKKDEVTFSDPFRVDSSAYFLVPRVVENVL